MYPAVPEKPRSQNPNKHLRKSANVRARKRAKPRKIGVLWCKIEMFVGFGFWSSDLNRKLEAGFLDEILKEIEDKIEPKT